MELSKKKNIASTLFTIIVIVLGGVTLFWFKKQNTALTQNNQNLIQSSKNLEDAYIHTIEMQWFLEGAHISPETQLTDKNNNTLSLGSIVGLADRPTYVLNFNWDACEDCVKQEMEFIEKTIGSTHRIAIIISFDSVNEYFAYVKSNSSSLPIYYASKDRKILDGLTHDFGVYGFILTKDGKISLPHIANSSFKELSERYYNMLANRL